MSWRGIEKTFPLVYKTPPFAPSLRLVPSGDVLISLDAMPFGPK
jgi:hypothetical protein